MGLRGSRDLTSAIAVRRGAGDGGWFPAVRGGEREVVALWWLPVSGPRWLFACEPERGRPSPGTAENVAGRAARAIIQPVWPRSLPPNRLHETGLNDAEFLSLGL
jgi:hypothetical protein